MTYVSVIATRRSLKKAMETPKVRMYSRFLGRISFPREQCRGIFIASMRVIFKRCFSAKYVGRIPVMSGFAYGALPMVKLSALLPIVFHRVSLITSRYRHSSFRFSDFFWDRNLDSEKEVFPPDR